MENLTLPELAQFVGMLQLQLLDARNKIAQLEAQLEQPEPVKDSPSES